MTGIYTNPKDFLAGKGFAGFHGVLEVKLVITQSGCEESSQRWLTVGCPPPHNSKTPGKGDALVHDITTSYVDATSLQLLKYSAPSPINNNCSQFYIDCSDYLTFT